MERRLVHGILIVLTLVALAGGIAALGYRRTRPGGPIASLNEVRARARARRFDEARSLLAGYLQAHPGDRRAHLLMAQLATEPPNPAPELALGELRALRPETTQEAARLRFFQGKAQYQKGRYDLAEVSWREALRLDPIVPEAGWALLDLLDKEGRVEEAHRLGLHLHELEPDPRDRVRILLEVARLDIEKVAPGSQLPLFEPLVRQHPENAPLAQVVGLALIRQNRTESGLEILRDTLRRHPESPEIWDTWLTGLYEASEFDRLAAEFDHLPRTIAADPRFAKHEGRIAQNARDWARAVRAYRSAHALEPFDQGVLYRFWFVLRQAGETAEFARIDRVYARYKEAYLQLRGSYLEMDPAAGQTAAGPDEMGKRRGVYYEAITIPTLGLQPHPDLYRRLADLRERLGRTDEARAWHRLVLRDVPGDSVSLAALERLK
jgi:tetratricopeptide (TPR) repeat protein